MKILLRIGAVSLLLAAVACSKPAPPDKHQPPEPQASHDTELRDAIEPDVLDAAQKQADAIDAQTGG